MVLVPLGVIKTGNIVAIGRILGIRIILSANGDFVVTAHRNLGKVRGIGHDDFQSVATLADAQVLAGCLGYSVFIQAAFNGQGFIQLPGDFLAVVAHEFQAVVQGGHGLGILASLVGIYNAGDVRAAKIFLAGLAVFALLSFFRLDDGSAVPLFAVGPRQAIFAGQAKGAFLAVRTIFA